MTVAGLAILVAAYLLVAGVGLDAAVAVFIVALLPIGIGAGVFQSPNNSAVLGSVPQERLGVTSGMLTITRITGQITGIAVLGTFWAWRVASIAGSRVDATDAPATAQAQGLQDTALVVAGMMLVSLVLAAWGWFLDHRERAVASPVEAHGG